MTRTADARRPLALITGAHGGMGIACARVFGRRYDLLLTDKDPDRLDVLRAQLTEDGAVVAGQVAGDLSDPAILAAVIEQVRSVGRLGALVHTAGLSPSLAEWDTIVELNLAVTHRLVAGVEPFLGFGSAAVLIASMSGHRVNVPPEAEAILDAALEPDLPGRIEPHLEAARANINMPLAQPAYAFTKYGVIRLCKQKARHWGRLGARIVSISPGMISTPMGRLEVAANPAADGLLEATPAGRWGTSLDIANAAEFLCSDLAGFISGCDLLVDGGLTHALRFPG